MTYFKLPNRQVDEPLAYDEAVDNRSWDDMKALFAEIF